VREGVEAKGRRYLLEGRLQVSHVGPNDVRARCRGGGHLYEISYDNDWTCTCPARGRCAHIVAAQLVVVVETTSES